MTDLPHAIQYEKAIDALKHDGVIAYPTEAVYGLGCSPFSEKAVKKLLGLKNRSAHKGLILIAADFSQLESLLRPLAPERLNLILATWPGPVSWAWPKTDKVPACIHGDWDSVVVRVSAHPVVRQLCRQFAGPLVSTSANHQSEIPCKTAPEVRECFGTRLDYIVEGSIGDLDKPTPIYDALTSKVLR